MKIHPIAFDSLGTRSMATYVETKDCKVLIDPGVALGPLRYGLSPHPIEFQRLKEHWNAIEKYAIKAEILIVTHYHYDHHTPNEPEIYKDKIVLLKHPTEQINLSQKNRAKFFLEQLKNIPKKIEYSDGKEFAFKYTNIKFSQPVFHGTNSKLGYVTEVLIKEGGECFVHTSDVEGPSIDNQVEFILQERPNIIFLDGPMTYMLGYRYSATSLKKSIENIVKIIHSTPVEKFILDHHLLRDLKWRERMSNVFEIAGKKQVKILTAAEFLGERNDLLEAKRKELYKRYPK